MLRNPEKGNEARIALSEGQVFVRSRAVVSRVVAGETLIVPVRGKVGDLASIYSFNETGSLIWKLLDTPRMVGEVVGGVADEYQIDTEQVRLDVLRFLGEMRGVGLIAISQARISHRQMSATDDCAVGSCLSEVPQSAAVGGTEGPVGRESLAPPEAG